MEENKEQASQEETPKKEGGKKKKISLEEFKMKSFVTKVKVDQMQFLKTAGG